MDFTLLIAYVFSILVLIITPGPVMALIISVSSHKKNRVISTIFGTNAASLLYISIAALTIAGVLELSDDLVALLSLLGGVFIGYVGIKILHGCVKSKKAKEIVKQSKTIEGGFLSGFFVAIANPKDIIFFISFFPQFILITDTFAKSITILSMIWILIDFLVLFFCSRVIQKQTIKTKNIIELLSGILLLLLAIFSIYFNFSSLIEILVAL